MGDHSDIEWTDATWNPVVGCSRVSSGCDNCYAMFDAHRNLHPDHRGLTRVRPPGSPRPGVDWNGVVRSLPGRFSIPILWTRPRNIFVNSMSDLFHPAVEFEFIAMGFAVMAIAKQHTYQVLTKRLDRARDFFKWYGRQKHDLEHWASQAASAYARAAELRPAESRMAARVCELMRSTKLRYGPDVLTPLPHVQIGGSIEDQATADERMPLLRCLPNAAPWVSYGPALGLVDWSPWVPYLTRIVIEGESTHRARPFHASWAARLIEQTRDTNCAAFVKQLGCHVIADVDGFPGELAEPDESGNRRAMLQSRKGKDMNEWPPALRVREEWVAP